MAKENCGFVVDILGIDKWELIYAIRGIYGGKMSFLEKCYKKDSPLNPTDICTDFMRENLIQILTMYYWLKERIA